MIKLIVLVFIFNVLYFVGYCILHLAQTINHVCGYIYYGGF